MLQPRDPSRIALALGRALSRLGLLTLPLGLGVVLGYLASERGLPWLPTVLEAILVTGVLALLAIWFGRLLQGRAFVATRGALGLRRGAGAALLLACLGAAARLLLFAAEEPSPLTATPRPQLLEAFRLDSGRIVELEHGVAARLGEAERRFGPLLRVEGGVPGADAERYLVDLWASLYRQAYALDSVRVFYEDWYRFDPSRRERSLHLRSFLLSYLAELTLYEQGGRAVLLLGANPAVVRLLNGALPERDLPAGTFSGLSQEVLGSRDLARVLAGREYLRGMEHALDARSEAEDYGFGELWRRVDRCLTRLEPRLRPGLAGATLASDLQPLRRALRRVWYPTQSQVAEWMGDARLARRRHGLISAAQIREFEAGLRPGDVLLGRKAWYVSNLALPGFWPHALIYLGSPQALAAATDSPEVRAWVASQGVSGGLPELLEARAPAAWRRYLEAEGDEPRRVLEAISEGVSLSTWEHAAGDHLAALRPRLGPLDTAQALALAFGALGRPYDFDFDFASADALVCTELVWRAFRPAAGKQGLDFELVEVLGRATLPANDLLRQHAQRVAAGQAQMDFVAFLDGIQRDGQAVWRDEAALLASWRRPQWDFLQP